MINPTQIVPGIIFYSYLTSTRKEKVGFWENNTLVLLVSGQLLFETATQKVTLKKGEMLLIRKNQLGQLIKQPLPGEDYETIVISLQEDLLRKIALEEQIVVQQKYEGPLNIVLAANEYLRGYFQSIVPYVRNPAGNITTEIGVLKVKEATKLLLHIMPALSTFLFDFSASHKMDLEKMMLSNFHYNIPIERFAQLTGRSLASFKRDFQKIFGIPPGRWLLEKRLAEALHLMEKKHLKPSVFYNDLGFETLSHFSHSFKKKYGKAPSEMI
jgi:AraC family transcriptional regulator, exoenzyme S synthesis regulatory protein ExsA